MAFTPNSTVYLLDTPLDNKYKNVLHFPSAIAQATHFLSCVKHTFEGVTYQRKDKSIRVDKNIDELWNANYAMYMNANFSDKWFYAFIVKMEYVSAKVTDIFIETDVYQTWLFECTLNKSFVVREHVADDTIGKNLVDEQLEFGEYKMHGYNPVGKLGDYWNILAVSDNSPLGVTAPIGNLYGNVVTGLTYFPFQNNAEGIAWLKSTIATYDQAGKSDAIVMIFAVPELVIPGVNEYGWALGEPIHTGEPYGIDFFTAQKQYEDIDGYVPKNNKLHTYPFKFMYASNNTGQSATYRYEDFDTPDYPNDMKFTVIGSLTPNAMIMLAPYNYKGVGSVAYEYGLTLTGFPMGSWTSDTFTAWFAQNSASMGVAVAGSAVAIIGGIATANAIAVGGGVLGIASQMAQLSKASIQPDQSKGQVGGGTLQYGTGRLDFFYAHMTIMSEFAKKIDDFLSMFGYKVNALKVPNTHSRLNWNYIQTIDVNITGAIPSEDMQKLKEIYNNGVTLWHNPATFLDYSQLNYII